MHGGLVADGELVVPGGYCPVRVRQRIPLISCRFVHFGGRPDLMPLGSNGSSLVHCPLVRSPRPMLGASHDTLQLLKHGLVATSWSAWSADAILTVRWVFGPDLGRRQRSSRAGYAVHGGVPTRACATRRSSC